MDDRELEWESVVVVVAGVDDDDDGVPDLDEDGEDDEDGPLYNGGFELNGVGANVT